MIERVVRRKKESIITELGKSEMGTHLGEKKNLILNSFTVLDFWGVF